LTKPVVHCALTLHRLQTALERLVSEWDAYLQEWMQMDTGPDVQFGKDVIPHALAEQFKIFAYHFTGFWQACTAHLL
jgi:hypothetical protein